MLTQLILAAALAAFAASFSLLLAGALGGTAMGVAPHWTFSLVEPIVCPEGSQISYYSVTRSYHQPGESEPHVECVGEGGETQEVLLPAILAVLGLSFVVPFAVSFLILFIPISIAAFFIVGRLTSGGGEKTKEGD